MFFTGIEGNKWREEEGKKEEVLCPWCVGQRRIRRKEIRRRRRRRVRTEEETEEK